MCFNILLKLLFNKFEFFRENLFMTLDSLIHNLLNTYVGTGWFLNFFSGKFSFFILFVWRYWGLTQNLLTKISFGISINKWKINKFGNWVIAMNIIVNCFLIRKLKLMLVISPIYDNFTQIQTVYLADRTKLCYEILIFC